MSVTGGRPGPRPPVEFERRKAARSADCKETAVNHQNEAPFHQCHRHCYCHRRHHSCITFIFSIITISTLLTTLAFRQSAFSQFGVCTSVAKIFGGNVMKKHV